MKKEFTPKSRREKLVIQELDGEVLIYDLQSDKAFCLNITSSLVWQACDGSKNVSEISEWVSEKLNAANNEDLVWLALDQLKKENLMEETNLPNKFKGLKRREVIKKIGLASVVALPVIASLSAPVAGATGTCTTVMNGCNCGAGDNQPSGSFCMPSGLFAMVCANTSCRCLSMGSSSTPNDDCVP